MRLWVRLRCRSRRFLGRTGGDEGSTLRWMDRQIGIQTDRQTDRKAEDPDKQREDSVQGRQTDTETERQMDRPRGLRAFTPMGCMQGKETRSRVSFLPDDMQQAVGWQAQARHSHDELFIDLFDQRSIPDDVKRCSGSISWR